MAIYELPGRQHSRSRMKTPLLSGRARANATVQSTVILPNSASDTAPVYVPRQDIAALGKLLLVSGLSRVSSSVQRKYHQRNHPELCGDERLASDRADHLTANCIALIDATNAALSDIASTPRLAWAHIRGQCRTRNSAGSPWTVRSRSRELSRRAAPARCFHS